MIIIIDDNNMRFLRRDYEIILASKNEFRFLKYFYLNRYSQADPHRKINFTKEGAKFFLFLLKEIKFQKRNFE